MKFVVRRAVASVVITPAVAGLYFYLYAGLVAVATEPAPPSEVWSNGLVLGLMVSVWFVADEIAKLVRK